jgi:hypothetical protein
MTIAQITRTIRLLIEQMVVEGKTLQEITDTVSLYTSNFSFAVRNKLEDFSFSETLLRNTASPAFRNDIGELYRNSQSQVARQSGRVVQDVNRILTDGFAAGKSTGQLMNELEYALNVRKDVMNTIIETSARGFDRVSTLASAEKAGISRFRYHGPKTNIRPFCEDLMELSARGESWTLDEIKKMDNGHGLPAHVHCGGYNCRHRWKPLFS